MSAVENCVKIYINKKNLAYSFFYLYKSSTDDKSLLLDFKDFYIREKLSKSTNFDTSFFLSRSIKITNKSRAIYMSLIYKKVIEANDNEIKDKLLSLFSAIVNTIREDINESSKCLVSKLSSDASEESKNTGSSASSSYEESDDDELGEIKSLIHNTFISLKPELEESISNMEKIPAGVIYGNKSKGELLSKTEKLREGIKNFENLIH